MYIFYQIWKIFWPLFRYTLCPFLFSPSLILHYTDVDIFDSVLQISSTLFIFLHSFFFLLRRLDHFSLSVLKLTDSSPCLNLLKPSSEFFISFTVLTSSKICLIPFYYFFIDIFHLFTHCFPGFLYFFEYI